MHLGDDVGAVDLDVLAFGRAQRDVQDGTVLGHVDLLAREHRVDAGPETGGVGQRQEEADGLVGQAVLRVVEVQAVDLEGEPLAARAVLREQLAEVHVLDRLVVRLERLPFGGAGDRHGRIFTQSVVASRPARVGHFAAPACPTSCRTQVLPSGSAKSANDS